MLRKEREQRAGCVMGKAQKVSGPRQSLEDRISGYLQEHPEPPEILRPVLEKVLEVLVIFRQYKPGRWVTPNEVAEILGGGMRPAAARTAMTQLANKGKIEVEEESMHRRRYRYK